MSKQINYGGVTYDLGINQMLSESYDAKHFSDPTVYITAEMKVLGNRHGEIAMEGESGMSLLDAVLASKYVAAKLTIPFTMEYVKAHKADIDTLVECIAGQMTTINLSAQEGMTESQRNMARAVNIDSMAARVAKSEILKHGHPWDAETFRESCKGTIRDTAVAKMTAENSLSASSRTPITSEAAKDMMETSRKKVVDVTSAQGQVNKAVRIMATAAGLKKVPIFNVKTKKMMEDWVAKLYKVMDDHKGDKEYSPELAMQILKDIKDGLGVEPTYDRVMVEFTNVEEDEISRKASAIYSSYIGQ